MPMPHVAVLSDRAWVGARHFTDKVALLDVLPWESVWTTPWESDAHLVTYKAVGAHMDRWPRCNKSSLQGLRDAGADLLATMLVLDYDNPDHRKWTAAGLRTWLSDLMALADDWNVAWQWALIYTTTHGARIVYVLTDPIPVDEAEGKHRWLVQEFTKRGMVFDPACSDWTRIFRLPFVIRDGNKTWEETEDVSEFLEQEDTYLDPEDLGSIGRLKSGRKLQFDELTLPKPEFDKAMELLSEISEITGHQNQSKFRKDAKKRLIGRECHDCLFKHTPLAQPGARHNTILAYVGEAVTLLFRLEPAPQPDHIFALFLDPVLQLDADEDTSDWTDILWQHICYCWAREQAEEDARLEDKREREQDTLASLDTVVAGMRVWCPDRMLLASDGESREWANGRLLALYKRDIFVMKRDGRYDALPVGKDGLVPRIRALGMENVIQVLVPKAKGEGWVYARSQDLINRHATLISDIKGKPQSFGAYITNLDREDATLNVGLYHRKTDLEPTYSLPVNKWLECFFGPDFAQGCNWIGHALAFEEGPCCALSIHGAPGAGKKLFARGLAECVSTETMAQAEDLVNDFQPGLMKSPFLVVDEGWPKGGRGGKHPADMFRELVGGGSRYVNTKFNPQVEITNPVRVLFTANNLNVVSMLTGDRDLSPEDRDALGIRLLHFAIGNKAAIHLRLMGGAKHTDGWIARDGGGRSDYILAKHFLWIYENMRLPKDSRLLVEGNGNKTLMLAMRTQSGGAPLVIEAIIRMVENKGKTYSGVAIEDFRLYVITSAVLEYYRANLTGGERLTAKRISQIFRGLVKGEPELKTIGNHGRKRWHEMDVELLQHSAQNDGWNCPVIDKLAEAQKALGLIA